MRTLLAFAAREALTEAELAAAVTRVERWYAPLWGVEPRAHRAGTTAHGLLLWSDPTDPCRWPAWVAREQRTVASLHAPLGFERLLDEPAGAPGPAGSDLDRAALALADRLADRPDDVDALTPPFVLATADESTGTLSLQTDLLGLGRLFELRTDELVVWSNRPVAALRFAAARAEADAEAWRRMAACDWPMGDATPYAGVRAVPGATRIEAGPLGVHRRSTDVLQRLVARRREPLGEDSLARSAAGLVAAARSVDALWPGVPDLSLSGGRDSRLVAATFLAAGIDVRFTTYAGADGESSTARALLARLPGAPEHRVPRPGPPGRGPRGGALTRARRWHDMTEGLRPAVYLKGSAPGRIPAHRRPLVCGVGGELGHSPGYPDDVERLEGLPPHRRLDALVRSLHAKITLPSGPSTAAIDAVSAQVAAVLGHAADRGVTDAKALDWFYADERLRRWGMAGESTGRVMPLLVPELVEASFGLTTAQSRDSALHTALIERLVPEWTGVPYFSATLRQRQQPSHRRLWEDDEADLVTGLLDHAQDWNDGFDRRRVRAVWARARAGRPAARDELLLQRVVWRAAFTDHLAAVNGEAAPVRTPGRTRTSPASSGNRTRRVHRLAAWANDVPVARRLARTRLGRLVRRRLGV